MNFFYRLYINAVAIVSGRKKIKSKTVLLFLYFKITLKYLLNKLINFNFSRESFLNLKINFFSYQDFRSLFSDIFVFEEYEFNNFFPDDDLDKKKNMLIIDGGSNIGMSVLYFKNKYPNSKVISFEPDQRTFKMLQKNVRQNGFNNTELHQKALGDKTEEVDFYVEKNKSGSLGMSINNRFKNRKKSYKKERVQVVKLSDYIKGEVDLLKLDIEEMEGTVIGELERNQKLKNIKRIIIEFHYNDNSKNNELSDILTILENQGFETKNFSTKDQLLEGSEFQCNSMIYARKFCESPKVN